MAVESQILPFGPTLMAGAIAGLAVDISLFPLDTIKTRLQSSQGFWKAGGFRNIYAGIGSVAVGSSPGSAVFFCTYESVKSLLCHSTSSNMQCFVHMFAASCGEMVSCFVRVPTEVIKQRTQANSKLSSLKILKLTMKSEGIRGLYRGYFSSVLRDKLQLAFRNAKNTKDYGKKVVWPTAPIAHRDIVPDLHKIHERWRAYMILRKIPREQWPEMHLKVIAAEVLKGRRKDWGYDRKWEGNYLASTSENENTASFVSSIGSLRSKDRFQKVLFSSYIKKVNKHNKCAERAIVVTDKFIYKLDSKKFNSLRTAIPITDLTGLSVTPGPDQMIILHLRGNNDLVTALTSRNEEERVGELVGIIVHRWHLLQGKDLRVIVNPQLQCMLGNKSRTLAVESTTITVNPAFKKDGQNLVLLWPICSA